MVDFSVSFKRSITVGNETIEFGMQAPVHVEPGEDYRVLCNLRYNELDKYVAEQIKSYLDVHPNLRAPAATRSVDADGQIYRYIPCDKMTVEIKDAKTYYKLFGGEFSKYGVAVYDELIAEMKWTIPIEGVKFTKGKWVAKVLMKDDKLPRKVVSFEQKG